MSDIYRALDPIRLLKQLETLQDALWQHSIQIKQFDTSDNTESREKYELSFKVNMCGNFGINPVNNLNNEILIKPEEGRKRKYRRKQKIKTPRWWRTKPDKFEPVWEEICKWLENNPERTATSLLSDLQKVYPGQYLDNQLRTLQRRVQKWRAKAIITFDDSWIDEEILTKNILPKDLKAVPLEIRIPLRNDLSIHNDS
ncbi:MAG: hypothetical protein ABFR75_12085 [Acidobacteriota bacterium]